MMSHRKQAKTNRLGSQKHRSLGADSLKVYSSISRIRAAILLVIFTVAQIAFVTPAYTFPGAQAVVSPVVNSLEMAPVTGKNQPFTFVDSLGKSFAVFSDGEQVDVPLFLGRVEWRDGRKQFTATRKITPLEKLYVITNPLDSQFLQVLERLPGGGFGRLLRYRADEIDLEFIYEDGSGSVTILDYRAGLFFRVEFSERTENSLSMTSPKDERVNVGKLVATVTPTTKVSFLSREEFSQPRGEGARLHSLIEMPSKESIWNARHLRGPPQGESKL